MSKEHKGIYYPPCKDDYLVAITVIEYKMRVLSNKFRKDDGSLIQDIKFSDLNKAAQLKLLDEQGLKFKTFGDSTQIIEKRKPTTTKRRR